MKFTFMCYSLLIWFIALCCFTIIVFVVDISKFSFNTSIFYLSIIARSELEGIWTASEVLGWPSQVVVCVVKGEKHVDDSTSDASCSEPSFF